MKPSDDRPHHEHRHTAQEDAAQPPKSAGHDTATPPALIAFMLQGWKSPPRALPKAVGQHRSFHARRRALSAMFPGETLIIPTGHEKVRSNDTHYRFRPGTDFYYLTGNLEPDCVLVMVPTAASGKKGSKPGHEDLLFVEPNPGRADATFFTDRNKGELWVGPRLGVEQSRARFGVDRAVGLPELKATLEALPRDKVRVLRGFSAGVEASLAKASTKAAPKASAKASQKRDAELATALSEMRLCKDAFELSELSAVIASTKRGFEDVIRILKNARSEREVEGVFNLRARVEGNDVGYGTIAAAGAHACTLHWTRNDGSIRKGDLLLLDAGVEGNSLYTADITRTLPISGTFTREQRIVYDLVYQAQAAAFAAVKPGNDFMAPNRAAMEVLAAGLEKLGILPGTADDALLDEHQFYKRYSLHNVSHMLGLDVHDCAKARQEVYKFGKLEAGMVLTIEPGLYFQTDDLTVPVKFRGIGVRIEDDVVVTAKGYRNLSKDIPSEATAVEKWIKSLW